MNVMSGFLYPLQPYRRMICRKRPDEQAHLPENSFILQWYVTIS
jgi:hypothetical protein